MLEGEDVSRALIGKPLVRKAPIFWEYGRNETFGFPREYPGQRSPNVAMREGKWKLLINADGSSLELYDIDSDPNEKKSVAAEKPNIAKRMSKAALDWRKGLP
jgi:arylsulfatase A-like enzyme